MRLYRESFPPSLGDESTFFGAQRCRRNKKSRSLGEFGEQGKRGPETDALTHSSSWESAKFFLEAEVYMHSFTVRRGMLPPVFLVGWAVAIGLGWKASRAIYFSVSLLQALTGPLPTDSPTSVLVSERRALVPGQARSLSSSTTTW